MVTSPYVSLLFCIVRSNVRSFRRTNERLHTVIHTMWSTISIHICDNTNYSNNTFISVHNHL